MSTDQLPDFDPYREWLGIPDGPRPPDHFTLLGLPPGETDEAKIRDAVRARMKAVRPRCLKHPELGTRLLNEIAAAQVCLLDPARATQYRSLLAGGTSTAAAAALVPQASEGEIYQILWEEEDQPLTVEEVESTAEGKKPKPKRRQPVVEAEEDTSASSGRLGLMIGAGAVGVLFVAVAALGIWAGLRGNQSAPPEVANMPAADQPATDPVADQVARAAEEKKRLEEEANRAEEQRRAEARQKEEEERRQREELLAEERRRKKEMQEEEERLREEAKREEARRRAEERKKDTEPRVAPPPAIAVKELAALQGHANDVQAVAFFADGRHLVSGDQGGWIRFWDFDGREGRAAGTLAWCVAHKNIQCLAVAPDGMHLFAGTLGGYAHMGRIEVTPDRVAERTHWAEQTNGPVSGATFLTAGNWVLFLGGELRMMGPKKQSLAMGLQEAGKREWTRLAATPDGERALLASDRNLNLYDLKATKLLTRYPEQPGTVLALAMSADGQVALSSSDDGAVVVWEPRGGVELRRLTGHDRPVTAAALSADGKLAVTAGRDGTVRLWEVAAGREVGRLTGPERVVTCLAFAPDGRRVAVGAEQVVRLWEVTGAAAAPEVADRPPAASPVEPSKASVEVLPDPGSLSGYRGQIGKVLYFEVVGRPAGAVWGTGVYTDDSMLAVAAVHAGAVRNGQRGIVKVTIRAGQRSYRGSQRNGVISDNYDRWDGSYSVEPVRGLPALADPGRR